MGKQNKKIILPTHENNLPSQGSAYFIENSY